MEKILVQQMIEDCAATVLGSGCGEIDKIVRDSREVQPGSLFVAIVGENMDGHKFIPKAWELGAEAVLAQKDNPYVKEEEIPEGKTVILVEDTIKAMGRIAASYKARLGLKSVAVTGSVGKTSCKDMVAAAISGGLHTAKTQGNFNNHIGVPLTIFSFDNNTEAAVIEMGMNHFGEIDYVADIAKPNYGIITNIGISHIEFLGSQEGILKAKLELVPHIQPGGTLFLNGDDPLLYGMKDHLSVNTEYFGFEEHNDARVLDLSLTPQAHLQLKLAYRGELYEFVLNTMGRHMAYNALPAIMTAVHMGLTKEEILKGLAGYVPTPHRLEVIHTPQYLLLDDTYNASPTSMCSALQAMDSIPSPQRRVAILGDMFELGEYAQSGHEEVGRFAAKESGVSVLVCGGPMARWIYEAAAQREDLERYYFEDVEQMEKNLFTILKKDDIILLKASHSMHFTEVCERLAKYE